MAGSVDQQLHRLAILSPVELRAEWLQQFKRPAPTVGVRLLALELAYRFQEKLYGGLPAEHPRELDRMAKRYGTKGEIEVNASAKLKPGTRLVRDWHDQPHQVLIRDDGYLYQDRVYRSLTQIAREITGSNWSGPRFFGLKRRTGANG